ncbi:MAG: hypothetical protein L3J82_02270 [Planctomycetes bacterium]|nr:hypothetical protein [Planctomycetota bacterium]
MRYVALTFFLLCFSGYLAAQAFVSPAAGDVIAGGVRIDIRTSGAQKAELMFAADGQNFKPAGEIKDNRAIFRLPAVNVSAARFRLKTDAGSVAFSGKFRIDSIAPVSLIDGKARLEGGELVVPFLAYDPSTLAPVKTVTLHLGSPSNPALDTSSKSAGEFRVALPPVGQHKLYVIATDIAGNIEAKQVPDVLNLLVDRNPPSGWVRLSPAVKYLVGSDQVTLSWQLRDPTLDTDSIKLDLQLGDTFLPIFSESRASGSRQWLVPRMYKRNAQIRIRASDSAGNQFSATSAPFDIIPSRPVAAISGDREIPGGIAFEIQLAGDSWLENSKVRHEIDFWRGDLLADGKVRWEDKPYARNIRLQTDNTYHYKGDRIKKTFCAVIRIPSESALSERIPFDRKDTESATLFGQLRLLGVELIDPDVQSPLRPGQKLLLQWVNPNIPRLGYTMALEYSTNGGRSWRVIEEGLDVSEFRDSDSFEWTIPDDLRAGSLLLRAVTTAPHRGREAVISRPLLRTIPIDAAPPQGRLSAPMDNTGRTIRDVTTLTAAAFKVEAFDVDGRWTSSSLWARKDGGTWQKLKTSGLENLAISGLTEGRWEFYLELSDSNGNNTAEPEVESLADASMTIDLTAPTSSGGARGGRVSTAGKPLRIEWSISDSALPPLPAILEGSLDNGQTWHPVAAPQKAVGHYPLTIIVGETTVMQLRLTARDRVGNSSQRILGEFEFRPAISFSVMPSLQNKGTNGLKIDAQVTGIDMSTLTHIEVWQTYDDGVSWKLLGTHQPFAFADGLLIAYPVSNQRIGLSLSGIHTDGHREGRPLPGDVPELSVEYDNTPPVLHASVTPVQVVFLPSDPPPILNISASDETELISLILEVKNDGKVIDTPELSSTGEVTWRAILELKESHTAYDITVTATDSADNKTVRKLTLVIQPSLKLDYVRIQGEPVYYTGSRRIVEWAYDGAGGEFGSGGTCKLEVIDSTGSATVLMQNQTDDGDWLWKLLPMTEGDYTLRLTTWPSGAKKSEVVGSEPFFVRQAKPLVVMVTPESVSGILREYPVKFEVTQDGGQYAIPLKSTKLFWRLDTSTDWKTSTDIFRQVGWKQPEISQQSSFIPIYGEGSYSAYVTVEDIHGNISEIPEPVEIRFDLRPPTGELKTMSGGTSLQVTWEAQDANLDISRLSFEYQYGDHLRWYSWQKFEGESSSVESAGKAEGSFVIDSSEGPRTRVRMHVFDLAGHETVIYSGQSQTGSGASYVAARPTETQQDIQRGADPYTTPEYARRGTFDIRIHEVTAWDTPATGVKLYWRKRGSPAWQVTEGSGREWKRVRFNTSQSGVYQFIAVVSNARGEADQHVPRSGDGGMVVFADTDIELEIWVDATPFQLRVDSYPPPDTQPDPAKKALGILLPAEFKAITGDVYPLTFTVTHGLRGIELIFTVDVSIDGGRTWTSSVLDVSTLIHEPITGRDADPYWQEVRYSTRWEAPIQPASKAILRVTAIETGKLSGRAAVGLTPVFEVIAPGSEPEQMKPELKTNGLYVQKKIEAGEKELTQSNPTDALKHFKEAQRSNVAIKSEIELGLSKSYEALGKKRLASFHKLRAKHGG